MGPCTHKDVAEVLPLYHVQKSSPNHGYCIHSIILEKIGYHIWPLNKFTKYSNHELFYVKGHTASSSIAKNSVGVSGQSKSAAGIIRE